MQLHPRSLKGRLVVDDPIFTWNPSILDRVPTDELLELCDKLIVLSEEQHALLEQRRHVNNLLRIQIQQFEELGVGRSIVQVFLDPIKEAKLVRLHELRRAVLCHISVVRRLYGRGSRESRWRCTVRLDMVRRRSALLNLISDNASAFTATVFRRRLRLLMLRLLLNGWRVRYETMLRFGALRLVTQWRVSINCTGRSPFTLGTLTLALSLIPGAARFFFSSAADTLPLAFLLPANPPVLALPARC